LDEAYHAHSRFEDRYGVVSKPGGRELNEDSCVLRDYSLRRNPKYLCFMALADGMGGHQAGDVASQVAVEMLEDIVGAKRFSDDVEFQETVEKELWSTFSTVNSHIYDLGQTSPERKGMGTTLTCALIGRGHAYVGHVGDSRAYLVSSEGVKQITDDHSVVGKMLSDGVLTEREAQLHEKRNVLNRAIGPEPNVEIDILKVPVHEGEVVFICSDGLYTVVDKKEIGNVLLTEGDLQTACERLVELAIARGTEDNVSAIAWRMPLEETLASSGIGGKATRAMGTREKFPARVVVLITVLALMIGFGIGWGVGSLWNRDNDSQGERKSAEKTAQEKDSRGNDETGADPTAFSKGAIVKIQLQTPGHIYSLREMPDPSSIEKAPLKHGCKLKIVSRSDEDTEGRQWYEVQVLDSGPDKGKKGYARSDCLVKVENSGG